MMTQSYAEHIIGIAMLYVSISS